MSNRNGIYYREPDYSLGRFFISPILGCTARCMFCYIYTDGYTVKYKTNEMTIDVLVQWLLNNPDYKPGRTGSLLSIGAWGDPFPKSYSAGFVLDWIDRLSNLGNPIQIISRFEIDKDVIKEISHMPTYPNQILFSTSISTFARWQETDTFASPPEKRLSTQLQFQELGIPTNVMVKPFLPGITNLEIENFISQFKEYSVKTCVVGVFYWNDQILNIMSRRNLVTEEMNHYIREDSINHSLVCSPGSDYTTYHGSSFDEFCDKLNQAGVKVFKNSACVNAWLLGVQHVSSLFTNDPLGLCVKCGNCETH